MGQNQQNFGQRSTAANFANASGDQRFQQNLLQQKQAAALRGQQVGEQADIGNFNMQLRDRQLAEQEYMRNMPAQDLETLMSMPAYNKPEFGQFMSATGTSGTDYSGAAQKTYDAQMGDVNAKNATRQGNIQGGVAIAGTVAAMF
jgi:beta-mannanase